MVLLELQEEEAAEGAQDHTEASEPGWDDQEFQELDEFPTNEQTGKLLKFKLVVN